LLLQEQEKQRFRQTEAEQAAKRKRMEKKRLRSIS